MTLHKHQGQFTWDQVNILKYKEEGTHFKDITRQILFAGQPDLPCQWRYFEIAPGGHSTLERHHHLHVVMPIRGAGQALVGTEILALTLFDVVHIPSLAWHQFRATGSEPFGFLCLVPAERDRPERPNAGQLEDLKREPNIARFIRV